MQNYNSKFKIIFFGASKFVIPVIEMLHGNFDLVLVVTTERNDTDAVPAYCKEKNIPYVSIRSFDPSIIERIKSENADLGVLAYFGQFLPTEVLGIFPKGILNIHPSLLPLYRGPTPVQTAILNGDTKTGVTIIKLDNEMDHGPILGQTEESISPTDMTTTLHNRLFKKGSEMLYALIPDFFEGKLELKEQDHNKATFTKKDFVRQDGYFDIANPPTSEILDRMIRAYYPWPAAWTTMSIKGKMFRIKLLPEKMIQVEGGKPMNIKDFINGYPEMRGIIEKLLRL